jgi:outer membrane cobalamin receptor
MACAPGVVQAQESARVSYDIGAQDLGTALTQLAQQSNREIYFSADLTRGKRAPRLRGSMTVEQALGRLLDGTGLRYRFAAAGAIVIERAGELEPASWDETDAAAGASDPSIVVTGTRIRTRETGPSPVTEITREDFARQGASSPQDVLRTVPQNFLGGVQEFGAALSSTRNGNEGNLAGSTGVNLRGLGNAATLTLLNGRRLAQGGLGGYVDISTLPLSAMERIEIVADGASAIYGSDAVAGVVNFVLRDDFRGAETTLRYSTVTDGGLRRYSASQLFGVGSDDESLMVVLDYGRRKPLDAADRDFASGVGDPAGTRSDLTVGDERYSLLATFHKDLGESLRVEGLGFYNSRDSFSVNYDPFTLRTATRDNEQTEYGGTLEAEWSVGPDWRITGAQSYAYSDGYRVNLAPATGTQPALDNNIEVEQEVFTTTLDAEGGLFALPGGTARLAVGGEYRKETLFSEASFSPAPRPPISRGVVAGYAELFLPIVGQGNAGAFGQRLELTGAIRYEEYSDVGDTDNVKLGAVWEPVEGLALRGTYGTSFRAPYLYQFDATLASALIYPLPSSSGTIVTAIVSTSPRPIWGPRPPRRGRPGSTSRRPARAGCGSMAPTSTSISRTASPRMARPSTSSSTLCWSLSWRCRPTRASWRPFRRSSSWTIRSATR